MELSNIMERKYQVIKQAKTPEEAPQNGLLTTGSLEKQACPIQTLAALISVKTNARVRSMV